MPIKAYYNAATSQFLEDDPERILGVLTSEHHHALEEQQRYAWLEQISILKTALLMHVAGRLFLEMHIPRMGKRADAVLVLGSTIFVIEFKTGASKNNVNGLSQVEDYALDLKNFHEGSHRVPIVPLLVSRQKASSHSKDVQFAEDLVALPISTSPAELSELIKQICDSQQLPVINVSEWASKGYRPTPTIIEAAQVLYRTHSVADISRYDAGATNLQQLTAAVSEIINQARQNRTKVICFVTGVPGSGKTLAGLNLATKRSDEHREEHAVFLSGNGPLVDVLREALIRDRAQRECCSKKTIEREVRSFIQNIHHFRDHYVKNNDVPWEKVVVFDEAQRAWTREQAAYFMQRKRNQPGFDMSEPEFLISIMNRHSDWCVVVCLVGGGQEINTGEAGISEWMNAIENRFSDWEAYVSSRILLPEYGSQSKIESFLALPRVFSNENLHLAVSIRSFRAESLSEFINYILNNEKEAAKLAYESIQTQYPILLTRNLGIARAWLRKRIRGTERIGLVAASGAQRLLPEGIHIKAAIDPINWFLNEKTDVRSSYYLEEAASEFVVQGLELDWIGMCWDGDFYHNGSGWSYQAFRGTSWQSVNNDRRRLYLKNAYRVLLTRARQGMVIFVPQGDDSDHTRHPSFYDGTYNYLRSCGLQSLD